MTKKQKTLTFSVLIIGIVTLITGVFCLVANLVQANKMADADFLVEKAEWVMEGVDKVVWNFTEIGKGSLTTDGHQNDYSFIWAIEGEKIKIETDWLYALEDEYEYSIDQDSRTLELKKDGKTIKFIAE